MVWPTALYEAGLALLTRVSALVWVAVTVALAGAEVAPLPETVAVLVIEPASRSVCVIVWVLVQLVDAPGANGPVPHANVPSISAVTETDPHTVTTLGLLLRWPVALCLSAPLFWSRVSALVWVAVTVALAGAEVAPLPEAVAVLVIEPASRSACVIVWVFVQLVDAPGANGPVPHANVPS